MSIAALLNFDKMIPSSQGTQLLTGVFEFLFYDTSCMNIRNG